MPDLILHNGKLHTQDSNTRQASAIALREGKILEVGSDDEICSLAVPHSKLIDLDKNLVLPGFTDAHFHFYEWALFQRGIDLGDTNSLEEVQERVRLVTSQTKPGEWILGQGWNQDHWSEPQFPSRIDLDRVSPNNPVILWRTDLHLAWVNSKALELAMINANTPDPDMGVIGRDERGQPDGILRELAINLVRKVIPPITENETDTAMHDAMAKIHKLGLTGVHDFRIMGGDDGSPALRAWQRLRDNKKLDLRSLVLLPGESLDEAIALGLQTGLGDNFLRIGPAKFFTDGSTGARTAWMLEPFEDGGTGLPLTPMEEIAQGISKAHKAGISTAIHAIGDRAIRELLDVYTEVFEGLGSHARLRVPHRIEHVQHSHPDDLRRLGPLGLVASVQPLHLADDMDMVQKATGQRARWAYAFRELLDSGATLALGSDCPVADPNPFLGIHAAVTRQRQDGTPDGGWFPSQRLTVTEAVWGYTMGCAKASGQEHLLGSLSPGKLADLIVLDRDIFTIPPMDIAETRVMMTILDGRIVFRR